MKDWIRNWWWRTFRPRYEVVVIFGEELDGPEGLMEGITEGGALWVGFYLFESRARRAAGAVTVDSSRPSPQCVYVYRMPRRDEYRKATIETREVA
jgi:hypothetical protein